MKFQYISDIHLESMNNNDYNQFLQLFQPSAPILILAGDIGNPYQPRYHEFLQYINNKYEKIFLITGNHEYYGNEIGATRQYLQELIKLFPNIIYLENNYYDYQNYRFIGTTLWSLITNPLYEINDTKYIHYLDINLYNKEHQQAKEFLETTLEMTMKEYQNQQSSSSSSLTQSDQQQFASNTSSIQKCIIITHHIPSYDLIHPKYLLPPYQNYNQWFATNLNSLLEKYHSIINCWIYGHTHTALIKYLYEVPYLCNPIGYKGENILTKQIINQIFDTDDIPLYSKEVQENNDNSKSSL